MHTKLHKNSNCYQANSAKFQSPRFRSIRVKCHDSAKNNTVNVFLKPEVYQRILAAVKRIPPLYHPVQPSILSFSLEAQNIRAIWWHCQASVGVFLSMVLVSLVLSWAHYPPFSLHSFFFISFLLHVSSFSLPLPLSLSLSLSLSLFLNIFYQSRYQSRLSLRNTHCIPALTYPGLMPVVLLSPNFLFASVQANIAFQPLLRRLPLFSFLSIALFRSLFREPDFSVYDASLKRYRRKAGSRKRRITKWSAGVGHHVYSLSRSVYLLPQVESWSSNIAIFAISPPTVVTKWHFSWC